MSLEPHRINTDDIVSKRPKQTLAGPALDQNVDNEDDRALVSYSGSKKESSSMFSNALADPPKDKNHVSAAPSAVSDHVRTVLNHTGTALDVSYATAAAAIAIKDGVYISAALHVLRGAQSIYKAVLEKYNVRRQDSENGNHYAEGIAKARSVTGRTKGLTAESSVKRPFIQNANLHPTEHFIAAVIEPGSQVRSTRESVQNDVGRLKKNQLAQPYIDKPLEVSSKRSSEFNKPLDLYEKGISSTGIGFGSDVVNIHAVQPPGNRVSVEISEEGLGGGGANFGGADKARLDHADFALKQACPAARGDRSCKLDARDRARESRSL